MVSIGDIQCAPKRREAFDAKGFVPLVHFRSIGDLAHLKSPSKRFVSMGAARSCYE